MIRILAALAALPLATGAASAAQMMFYQLPPGAYRLLLQATSYDTPPKTSSAAVNFRVVR